MIQDLQDLFEIVKLANGIRIPESPLRSLHPEGIYQYPVNPVNPVCKGESKSARPG